MEILRLLKELESLIASQKTLMGVTFDFRQDDILSLTNKIRMVVPTLLPEDVMTKTEQVLTRHLQSSEEVAAIMREIRTAALS